MSFAVIEENMYPSILILFKAHCICNKQGWGTFGGDKEDTRAENVKM